MLIINPNSGTRHAGHLEQDVRAALEGPGVTVETRYSQYAGHCGELADEAVKRHFYAVIAAGGDGTVNEVARAVVGSSTIMGIIPCGSGNGLARHLDESIDIDQAIRAIAADKVIHCDYGTANQHAFFVTFGLGFDATVSHDFATMKRRGLSSYVRSVLRKYLNYTPRTYTITTGNKSQQVKAFLIAVCNASQYGNNAYIAPDASVCDGMLDIVIIHSGNPLTRAFAGVDMFTGYIKRNVLVQCMRADKATIRQEPGPGHVDGDPVDMPAIIRIKCHPGKLRLFSNHESGHFKPILTPLRGLRYDIRFRIRSAINHLLSHK